MKKHMLVAALTMLTAAVNTNALDEEFMVVTLKDGTKVQYNVEQIERVEFEIVHTDDAFTVTPEGGATVGYATIPTMLRVKPAAAGDPTQFAFGTVEATEAKDLQAGEYGVWLKVSAAKIYNGDIDLAADKNSYTLTLVKYNPEGDPEVLENVTSGTLSTKINTKNNRVTITLDAVFDNGTAITANYTGLPSDVDALDAVVPEKQYGNELYFYNMNGEEKKTAIESVKKSVSSYSGKTTITFNLTDNYNNDDYEARLVLDPAFTDGLVSGTLYTFNMAETEGWEFRYGSIQLFHSPDSDSSKDYKNQADNGTMKIMINDDNTLKVFIDITNNYSNYMGAHTGDPQRVVLNFDGKTN